MQLWQASLILIQLHLDKIIGWYYLHIIALSKQYTINLLLNNHYSKKAIPHYIVISHLMHKQQLKIKSSIMDTNTHLNKVIFSFDSLNKELLLSFHLINTFPDQFSFLSVNWKDINTLITHYNRLKNIYKDSLNNQNTILVIADTSINNNVITLVSHICKGHNIINKSVHHTMNANSTEVEMFAIRYRIDQAMKLQDISKIVIIIDAIPAAKWIFNMSVHPYQLYSIKISRNLRESFKKNSNNSISF